MCKRPIMCNIHDVNLKMQVRWMRSLNDAKFIVSWVFILISKSMGVKRSKWYLMGPNWWPEVCDICPLVCWHVPSTHASLKVKSGIVLWLTIYWCTCSCCPVWSGYCLSGVNLTISKGCCNWSNPKVLQQTICAHTCSRDFEISIQWSR